MKSLKKIIRSIESESEEKNLKKILANFDRNIAILDVGCGFGYKIKLLKKFGFKNILGIEKNQFLVKKCQDNRLNVIGVEDFRENYQNKKFDLIVMSHIIEHFQYEDLKEFLEFYLDFLEDNGHLLILSPLYQENFYDDFDHVKPYHPLGIEMVFGNKNSQVQFYSKYTLKLVDLYYRREPFRLKFYRALVIETGNKLPEFINIILAFLFRFSFGTIGRPTGWLGLFKKC
ncbi:MAG: hypothetical protein A2287_06125 [Candidatus Melainabacteria bacterium RIFOXYA12_FULL_32_12]|nr:MAG: hypothetical protein A2255_00725 [Candidatus Melainabacteria bacterium RIFOXYA2_FULL_32_9]OGI27556.1 MAG: hypothetical protein A2287_06125 [Candidatus Melainabacteria bacterium RIFOXYA12_FULL_32_12]